MILLKKEKNCGCCIIPSRVLQTISTIMHELVFNLNLVTWNKMTFTMKNLLLKTYNVIL